MADTDLNALSTYADDAQQEVLKKAAAAENRSLSNFLLTAGLDRAKEQHGILSVGREVKSKKRAKARK